MPFSAGRLLAIALLCGWLLLIAIQPDPIGLISGYAHYSLLGVVGAIFANATGAGGGVVFIPVFNQLELSASAAVATSFAIQCCGMSVGALSWWSYLRASDKSQLAVMFDLLKFVLPATLMGLWLVQYAGVIEPPVLHRTFAVFSVLLAVAILASVRWARQGALRQTRQRVDTLALAVIGLVGGGITAWLSVGVGELLAVYLIMRGFSVYLAIATAVCLSALTVWAALPYHVLVADAVYWPLWLFAAAGAVIGASVARQIVLWLRPTRVKVFFALWVAFMGLVTL